MSFTKLYKASPYTTSGLVVGFVVSLASLHTLTEARSLNEMLGKLQQKHMSLFEEMLEMDNIFWQDADRLLATAQYNQKDKSGAVTVFDKEVVKLPEIVIKKLEGDKDTKAERSLSLSIKNLDVSKNALKVELDEDDGYAQVALPYENAQVILKVYPNGYALEAEKKITQEKKDEKGKVLGSSSYTAYNSYSQSFPYAINVRAVTPEFKDKTLTLTFGKRDAKRAIAVK